ncbi:hypothetical protein PsPphi15_gp10 [Pseudomonas phage phi15]|uniref:Uncharacterized protein n=1 Tax=Pseudomonas phage phi15 TaxID=988656 RepID=F0V6X1_9CAUD|nr:hypothetical protein PsPphi15_gp10 [Pseudomonas phage phi15]CBZ41983.1 hypothetical protein [Pseudomonas phage phi15]
MFRVNTSSVFQNHNGFFGGEENEPFERNVRTKPRRSASAQEAFEARKGKRNKPQRGKDNWAGLGASDEYSVKVQEQAIRMCPNGVPAWQKERAL